MRLTPIILFSTLFALLIPSLAAAETPTDPVETGEFAHAVKIQLDDDFEKSASATSALLMTRLSGPTSMNCSQAALTFSDLETCVVTAPGVGRAAGPAALAQQ